MQWTNTQPPKRMKFSGKWVELEKISELRYPRPRKRNMVGIHLHANTSY